MATPFAEPARRTFDDATALFSARRLGTSDHLYGLACECALKAVLSGAGFIPVSPPQKPQKPFGLHIDKLWNEYIAAISGRALNTLSIPSTNPFQAWKVEHRYLDDNAFSEARVLGHRSGAEDGMRVLQLAMLQGVVK